MDFLELVIVFGDYSHPKSYLSKKLSSLMVVANKLVGRDLGYNPDFFEPLILPNPEECTICFKSVCKFKKLDCNHQLCYECFQNIKDRCPFCRREGVNAITEIINETTSIIIHNNSNSSFEDLKTTVSEENGITVGMLIVTKLSDDLYEKSLLFSIIENRHDLQAFALEQGVWINDITNNCCKVTRLNPNIHKASIILNFTEEIPLQD